MECPLISAIVRAKNASKCMIGFDPSRHLPSNITAYLKTAGLIASGRVDLDD